MKHLPLLAGAVGLLGAGAHYFAVRKARELQSMPSPVSHAVLSKEPEGTQRFIERPDGTRIRAVVAGEGPTVVLAHGYGLTLGEWSLVWTRLLELGFRCIGFDLRGHGLSTIGTDGIGSTQMADDYEALFAALEIKDAVLVGHSTGGFLAIRALLEHPSLVERVRGLVGLATTAGQVMRGSPQNRVQVPLIKSGLIQGIASSPTYGWLFGASTCGDTPSPAVIQVFNELFVTQPHSRLWPILRALADESDYERLDQISVPTVVICGDSDRTTPRWHSEQIGARIPNARNVWIPGKGHLLNWEAPESLVEAIVSLL
ncbi:putative hydrolase [Enhygromyxa salina]|uniref:Putative hydrolase n=1 Tax=Enhygromyxa salina TaxID=215803 RepID=A0A0C2DDC8_9BACT|nr:alpha/beta hydrolase [Enhygromyxa salina]KIG19450.1 putative hydrolase [Enhygromyxa salina]